MAALAAHDLGTVCRHVAAYVTTRALEEAFYSKPGTHS
jgi:hypothetical protein